MSAGKLQEVTVPIWLGLINNKPQLHRMDEVTTQDQVYLHAIRLLATLNTKNNINYALAGNLLLFAM